MILLNFLNIRGSFPVEQGGLHMCWQIASKRLKDLQSCIVLPIGNLSAGLCRHRAILFKVIHKSQGYFHLVGED